MKNQTLSIIKKIYLLIVLIIFSVGCTTKKDESIHKYFVALNGNDTNIGSMKAPFRTIKKGVSVLSLGDTLIVSAGNYGHEYDINISTSGTKEFPIVIMAERSGSVILKGLRKQGEEDYSEKGGIVFNVINASYVIIDGFYITDYSVGVNLMGKVQNEKDRPHSIIVKRCVFNNNGEAGVQTSRVDSTIISECQFISDKIQKKDYIIAVQDYGCNFFNTKYSIVEGCYFFGAHHQSLSFKEGNKNCIARRNIFEGAQYTAIYLGQNRRADATNNNANPVCENITAEYNIVRPAKGFRVKSPLRVDNCKNAIIRNNYFEGFDETNNTGGINVWNEALGKIEIYNNILAFGKKNEHSAGISLELGGSSEVNVLIHNNTIYNVVRDLELARYRGDDTEQNFSFEKNIAYKCKHSKVSLKNNFIENPEFINGTPLQLSISVKPEKKKFSSYYQKLTKPFYLKHNSKAKGFGVKF